MNYDSDSPHGATTSSPTIIEQKVTMVPPAHSVECAWTTTTTTTEVEQQSSITLHPTIGVQGTLINVHVPVRHALRFENVKLMIGGIVLETGKQTQSDGSTLFWAHVPPLQLTASATMLSSPVTVPVALCFLDSNPVSQLSVAHFTYQNLASVGGDGHYDEVERTRRATWPIGSSSFKDSSPRYSYMLPGLESKANQFPMLNSFFHPVSSLRTDTLTFASGPSATPTEKILSSPFSRHDEVLYDGGPATPVPSTFLPRDTFLSRPPVATNDSASSLESFHSGRSLSAGDNSIDSAANGDIWHPSTSADDQGTQGRRVTRRRTSDHRLDSMSLTKYEPYPSLSKAVEFEVVGDYESIGRNWCQQEIERGRRLVRFTHTTANSLRKIRCSFEILPPINDPETNGNEGVIISFIHWAQRDEIYVTSVDIIYLLEHMLQVTFSIEQKNRVRRNLEGFHPLTASKCRPESSEFFKVIMSFGYPRPRHIEKDIKIFEWHCIPFALKKIIVKYSSLTHRNQAMLRSLPTPSTYSPHEVRPASLSTSTVATLQQHDPFQHANNTFFAATNPLTNPPSPLQPSAVSTSAMSRETLDRIQRFNMPNIP